jgi:hypothetical protein
MRWPVSPQTTPPFGVGGVAALKEQYEERFENELTSAVGGATSSRR